MLDELGRSSEAISYYEQSLQIRIDLLGDGNLSVAEVKNDMAECLLELGRANDSGAYFEQALAIRERLLGHHHPATIQTLNGLSRAYAHPSYVYKQTHTHVRRASVATFGSSTKKKGKSVANSDALQTHLNSAISSTLATDMRELKNFQRAEEELNECLASLKSLYFDSHPAIAAAVNNMGVLREDEREFEEALNLYKLALDKSVIALGDDHPQVLSIRENYALSLCHLNQHQLALDEFLLCLDSRLQHCYVSRPPSSRISHSDSNSLRDIPSRYPFFETFPEHEESDSEKCSDEKDKDECIEIQMDSVTDPEVASTLNHIGQCYRKLSMFNEAKECYEKSLSLRLHLQGADHPDYAATLNSLGVLLIESGEFEEAITSLTKSASAREDVYGRNHPFVSIALNNLGIAYLMMTNNSKAGPLLAESLKIRESNGASDSEMKSACLNFAALFDSQGDDKLSEKLKEAAEKYPNSSYPLEYFKPMAENEDVSQVEETDDMFNKNIDAVARDNTDRNNNNNNDNKEESVDVDLISQKLGSTDNRVTGEATEEIKLDPSVVVTGNGQEPMVYQQTL